MLEEKTLPERVRVANRERVLRGLNAQPNRAMPVVAAVAAATLLAGTMTWLVVGTDRESSPLASSATTDRVAAGQMQPIPPEVLYDVRDHVTADSLHRCGAPGWEPRWRAAARGTEVVVLASGTAVRFCELTPATVTLSQEVQPDGGLHIAFRSAAGTVAGVARPEAQSLQLTPADTRTAYGPAYVREGIFVAPNNISAATTMVQVTGSESGQPVRLPSAAVARVDRPRDRQTVDPELDACLTNSTVPPVVDREAWRPGATWTSRTGDLVRTARYEDLLVTCVFSEDSISTVVTDGISLVDGTVPGQPQWEVEANRLLYTSTVFVDFDWVGGADSSDTVAVSGLTLGTNVTDVELTRPMSGSVRARVVGGTFVLGGIDLNEGADEDRSQTRLIAYATDGTVLAVLRLPI